MPSWARRVVLGLMLGFAVAAGAQVNATVPKKSTPKQKARRQTSQQLERDLSFNLLEEAYSTSRDLPSVLRIPLLAEICQHALMINSRGRAGFFVARASGRGTVRTLHAASGPAAELDKKQKNNFKDWAEELYSLGNEFPAGSRERESAIVSATRSLIEADLDRAMEVFASSETENEGAFESHSGVDIQLFEALYRSKGVAAVPDLRAKAIELGDHGRYPFEAVNTILHRMNGPPEPVRQFFSDAFSYFQRSDMPIQRCFSFMGLVGSKEIRSQLESWQVRAAAQALADKITAYVQAQRQLKSLGSATDPGGPMVVKALKNAVKSFAPEIAATIPDPPAFVASVHREQAAGPSQPIAPVPDEALKTLHDAFEKNRTQVMVMNEDEVHDGPEMRETIDRAISIGADYVLRTVRAYEPQDHRYAMQITISPLMDTIQVGTRVNPAATLSSIRRVQDSELRARLLIGVAGSIQYMH